MNEQPKLPDHDIEEYWLSIKSSMNNFYSQAKLIPRPIDKWSQQLNKLQKMQNYLEIEFHIMKYLSLYSIDLLRFGEQYYINILITNLKRWDKLSNKYKFFESNDKKKNIAIVLLEIVYSLHKNNVELGDLFDDIELYIIYEDFTKLIEFSVEQNKPSILDKLIAYDYLNVMNTIKIIYAVNIEYSPALKLCGKKILSKIYS